MKRFSREILFLCGVAPVCVLSKFGETVSTVVKFSKGPRKYIFMAMKSDVGQKANLSVPFSGPIIGRRTIRRASHLLWQRTQAK